MKVTKEEFNALVIWLILIGAAFLATVLVYGYWVLVDLIGAVGGIAAAGVVGAVILSHVISNYFSYRFGDNNGRREEKGFMRGADKLADKTFSLAEKTLHAVTQERITYNHNVKHPEPSQPATQALDWRTLQGRIAVYQDENDGMIIDN